MFRKAQGGGPLIVIIIIGLLLFITFGIFLSSINRDKLEDIGESQLYRASISDLKIDIQNSIEDCIYQGIIDVIADTGIRDTTKKDFESLLENNITICTGELFEALEDQGFEISAKEPKVDMDFTDEVISTETEFEVEIERGEDKIEYDFFEVDFQRTNYEAISSFPTELRVVSNDGRAYFRLRPWTRINPITKRVGIKVEDKHFESLENEIVVGNLAYSGLHDGLSFTIPVEVAIRVRNKDYAGNKNKLVIAWWDPHFKIWRALTTQAKGDTLYANANHFTKFAVIERCAPIREQIPIVINSGNIFSQRYESCDANYWEVSYNGEIVAKDEDVVSSTSSSENIQYGFGRSCSGYVSIPKGIVQRKCTSGACGGWGGDGCTKEDEFGDEISGTCVVENLNGKCSCKEGFSGDPYARGIGPDEQRKGYSHYSCVGGTVTDGNGDGEIASIEFLGSGNACINDYSVVPVCFEDNCKIPAGSVQEVATGTNMKIILKVLQVFNDNQDACALGSVNFRIQGTGVVS